MTPSQANAIISEYRSGEPIVLMSKNHRITQRDIYTLLRAGHIPLRGTGRSSNKGKKRNCVSYYWQDFVIRPSLVEGVRCRVEALKKIKLEEFNPIGTL